MWGSSGRKFELYWALKMFFDVVGRVPGMLLVPVAYRLIYYAEVNELGLVAASVSICCFTDE